MELTIGGTAVASYVIDPKLDETLSPRPYLHPIRTLGGVLVSDAVPDDHRWHLGLALGVQDVNGTNLWGGRTYVRDQGYTWLPDHGRITHEGFDQATADRLVQRLAWRDPSGAELLREQRTITAEPLGAGWWLRLGWTLTATRGSVTLGSPATNGRPDGAGYGGAFFRIAPGDTPRVSAGELVGEEQTNGSTEPVVCWRGESGGRAVHADVRGVDPG